MISIINISKKLRRTDKHKYEVRINNQIITKFNHIREEGLAICLRKVADAVEKKRFIELTEITLGVIK